jgi:hypothetical protein
MTGFLPIFLFVVLVAIVAACFGAYAWMQITLMRAMLAIEKARQDALKEQRP